jgi:hypothetical protein
MKKNIGSGWVDRTTAADPSIAHPAAWVGRTSAPTEAWAAKPAVAAAPLREVTSQELTSKAGGENPGVRYDDDDFQRREGGRDRHLYDRPPCEDVAIPDAPPYRVYASPPSPPPPPPGSLLPMLAYSPPSRGFSPPSHAPPLSYVGKIPKTATEEGIGSMFAAMQLECTSVVVPPHFISHPSRHFHLHSHLPPGHSAPRHPKCKMRVRHFQNARRSFKGAQNGQPVPLRRRCNANRRLSCQCLATSP